MKGVIFTEFIEMMEREFGLEVADRVIASSEIPFKGHYTSVGTYDPQQIWQLVEALSKEMDIPIEELFRIYGQHLCKILINNHLYFLKENDDSFSFLERVESYIHPEVQKLYPDAELPRFDTVREGNTLFLTYHSPRRMGDFAKGIIEGCLEYFDETAQIDMKKMNKEGSVVEFKIQR